MSLARALTKRMRSHEEVPAANSNVNMNRAYSTRRFDKPIDRNKISLPLELISSSNALAYEAPDIHHMQAAQLQSQQATPTSATSSSSASSRKSYEDSVSSPGLSSASSVTSNDMSREASPVQEKHNTTFFHFEEESQPEPIIEESPLVVTPAEKETPNVPQRALSHTKRTHQALARQRSQRLSSPPPSTRNAPATRSSVDMFSAKPEADHPFGAELAQVNELAEEFGMKEMNRDIQILDEESQYLVDNGFQRFTAEDYICEIQPLYATAFPAPVTWL